MIETAILLVLTLFLDVLSIMQDAVGFTVNYFASV